MTTIVTRVGKGSPLTWTEVDSNFTNLNSAKYESGNNATFGTLAYTGTLTGGTGVVNLGSGQFYKDASGNVGIGTTSPATKLHLLTPSATAVGLRAGNSASYAEFQVDASGNSQLIAPNGVQIFNTNGAERMRIDSSGNVGIGLTSPTGKFEVATGGSTSITAALGGTFPAYTYRNGSGAWFHAGKHPSSDYFYIGNGATPTTNISMVVDSSGNVGIGTTSPSSYAPLTVRKYITSGSQNNVASFSDAVNATLTIGFTSGYANYICDNAQAFYTSNTERMRIDSSGNVLIRTSSSSGANFEVNGSMYNRDGYAMIGAYNSNGAYPPLSNVAIAFAWNFTAGGRENVIMNNDTSGGGFRFLQRTGTSTSNYLGRTDNNGVWYQGNNSSSWSTTSDVRIKTNIREINNALDKISELHPCHFEYIDKVGKTKTGFIAQEFETVLPGHVHEEYFVPEEYKDVIPEGESIKSIDIDLIPYLTKAIQELSAKVDTLQAELNTLKGN